MRVFRPLPSTCSCGGPVSLPRDAEVVKGGYVYTELPEAVYRIHAEGCPDAE